MYVKIGYLFSKGIEVINAVGLNEWCVAEGICESEDDHWVDPKIASEYRLTIRESEEWYKKEKEEEITSQKIILTIEQLREICVEAAARDQLGVPSLEEWLKNEEWRELIK